MARTSCAVPKTWALIAAAAGFISINWGVYIFAVNNGHVVDASLGYFITPLVNVAFGVMLLHERLHPVQWAALGVAVPAVILSAIGAGTVPTIALILAGSFGIYGADQAGDPDPGAALAHR